MCGESCKSEIRGASDGHRLRRQQVRPDPVVMFDDPLGAEVWTIADRMAVGDDDNLVAQGYRRTDGCVHAQICRPTCDQQPLGAKIGEVGLQRGLEERVVQLLAHDPIAWLSVK